MPVFSIQHITRYRYEKPVKESSNRIKIYPYVCEDQEVLNHEISITTQPEIFSYTDYYGNKEGFFNILSSHDELVISSKLIVRTLSEATLPMSLHSGWDSLKEQTMNDIHLIELGVKDIIKSQDKIDAIIEQLDPKTKSVGETVEACSTYIFTNFSYIKGITTIETTVDEILEVSAGVCQDFAHLMLQILRSLSIPSRYVSGYICPNKNGMRGEGATHAWVEAYIPDFGWAGIDPTNNVWVSNKHIKLAVGKHFIDCSPIKGTFKGNAKQKLSVYVSVGYENGNIYEEDNNVQMVTAEDDAFEPSIDGQQ